jgi:hypothetical protein
MTFSSLSIANPVQASAHFSRLFDECSFRVMHLSGDWSVELKLNAHSSIPTATFNAGMDLNPLPFPPLPEELVSRTC